jgi:O-antigen/teichoic acid export membrane protein
MKGDLRLGLSFLLLQLVPFAEVGIDNALIATRYAPAIVSAYDVYYRLFAYIPAIMSLVLFPLWPAIAKALAEGDFVWVRKAKTKAYLLVGVISVAFSVLLMVSHEWAVERWTGRPLPLDPLTVMAFASFSVLTSLTTVQSMVLNGHGLVREQVRFFGWYLVFLLPLKLFAVSAYGMTVMAWLTVLMALARLVMLGWLAEKRWLRLAPSFRNGARNA